MMSDFEKAQNALGLSNDSSGSSGSLALPENPVSSIVNTMPIVSTPKNISLIPEKPAVPAVNSAMFLDVKALAKYMKENGIKLPPNWQTIALWGGLGIAVGFSIAKIMDNK